MIAGSFLVGLHPLIVDHTSSSSGKINELNKKLRNVSPWFHLNFETGSSFFSSTVRAASLSDNGSISLRERLDNDCVLQQPRRGEHL